MSDEFLDQRVDQITDPVDREAVAVLRLNGMLDVFDGAALAFPCETGDVLQAMQTLGYRLDGDYLIALLNRGCLSVPSVSGKRRWSAWDCWNLVSILEARRRFTLHPAHVHKMTAMERLTLEAERDGQQSAFGDLDRFDVETLLLLLEQAEASAIRHVLRLAVTAKIRSGESL